MIRHLHISLLILLMCITAAVYSQDKATIQIKTFDESLQVLPNIELSVNRGAFVKTGQRGTAFVDLATTSLPPKTIELRNENLEAASWNFGKGVLEVIVRKKSYRIETYYLTRPDGERLGNTTVLFVGADTLRFTSDASGKLEIPLSKNEPTPGKEKFLVANRRVEKVTYSTNGNFIAVADVKRKMEVIADSEPSEKNAVFDLANLDSIQSLTVFYAVFKNYPFSKLDEQTRRKIDLKLYELMTTAQKSNQLPGLSDDVLGRISDSTFVREDIKSLVSRAELERRMLNELRDDFNEKIQLLNEKLEGGIETLSDDEREALLADIRHLETILKENENRFYRNQADYHNVLTSIKEKFFDVRDLENRLTLSEAQREQERAAYRRKMLTTIFVVSALGVIIVLLVYFTRKLNRKKKELLVANNEIVRINTNLENLVHQRTGMLVRAHAELDTFLYKASHDLQGPICSIIGLCHIASRTANAESRELIQRTYATAKAMDRMLKKLKIISEVNRPSDPSLIRLRPEIDLVIAQLDDMVRQQNVTLHIDCADSVVFYSHRDLLYFILLNVLENAAYFSGLRPEVRPEVTIKAVLQAGSVHISVVDNGVGIPEDIRDRVWDMFYIGNEMSRGNGLGLYIVRKSVQAMGGYISLESVEGKFTRVILVIPVTAVDAPQQSNAEPAKSLQLAD